jgi:hypothetical protein
MSTSQAPANTAAEVPPIDVPAGVALTPYVPWSGQTCWRVEGPRGALLVTQAPLMGPWTAWRPDAPATAPALATGRDRDRVLTSAARIAAALP